MATATYARRNPGENSKDVSTHTLSSSPLEDLSPTQDIALAEMSRRMKKRSRLVLSGSINSVQNLAVEPSSKKSKPSDSHGLQSLSLETLPSTPNITLDRPMFPLGTQQIYDSIFETPESSTSNSIQAQPLLDQLSPIPVARRMLSRSNSRDLKENISRNSRPGLASPFSSRPSSRASSPFRGFKPARRPLHVKARTLSTNLPKSNNVSNSIDRYSAAKDCDAVLDSTYMTSAPISASHTTFHARTGSIPAMTSALFDNIASQDWLVPPKVLLRSPTASFDDLQLDTFQAEHPSFYFDVPAKVSTPPRKRSTTITQKSFANQDSSLTDGQSVTLQPTSSVEEDVVMSDSSVPLRPSRRKRRAVVHISSDSIFSSALDFSAYTSDESLSDQPRVPIESLNSPQDVDLTTHNVMPTLDPAFSPASTSAATFQLAPLMEICDTDPTAQSASSKTIPSAAAALKSQLYRVSLSCRSQSLPDKPDADTNELHEMFTALELDEHSNPEDLLHNHSVARNDQLVQVEAIIPGDTKDQVHRRRRGDTIRASDFSRPSVSFGSASAAGSNTPATEPDAPLATRRARSGTVTLASVQSHPIEVMITDGVRKTQPKVRTRARKQNSSRRPPGQATIIMKIDNEPLPPQGSDEEDDELLLTGQVWTDFSDT